VVFVCGVFVCVCFCVWVCVCGCGCWWVCVCVCWCVCVWVGFVLLQVWLSQGGVVLYILVILLFAVGHVKEAYAYCFES
jgi:hypothetical protein